MDDGGLIDEVEDTIRQACAGQAVAKIRVAVGREVTVSKVEIAKELHRRFPQASIELLETKESDSIVVRDIEVE